MLKLLQYGIILFRNTICIMLVSIIIHLSALTGCAPEPPSLPPSKTPAQGPQLDVKKVQYGSVSGLLVEHIHTAEPQLKGVVLVTGKPLSFWAEHGRGCLRSTIEPDALGFIVSGSVDEALAVEEAQTYLELLLSKKNPEHIVTVIMEPPCEQK